MVLNQVRSASIEKSYFTILSFGRRLWQLFRVVFGYAVLRHSSTTLRHVDHVLVFPEAVRTREREGEKNVIKFFFFSPGNDPSRPQRNSLWLLLRNTHEINILHHRCTEIDAQRSVGRRLYLFFLLLLNRVCVLLLSLRRLLMSLSPCYFLLLRRFYT